MNVTTCPTCRRRMHQDGTNAIVNRLIERVPHPCKFSPCKVKNYLKEIKEHETRCPERTIKCPYLRCDDIVKVNEYKEHAMESNKYNVYSNNLSRTIDSAFSQNYLSASICSWPMGAFQDQNEIFYLHQHFFPTEETFAWYVTIAGTSTEAEKYLAKVTLKNQNDDKKSLSFAQNVISMDSAPSDDKSVLASKSVMFVHWRTMSGFMKWKIVTHIGAEP